MGRFSRGRSYNDSVVVWLSWGQELTPRPSGQKVKAQRHWTNDRRHAKELSLPFSF